MNASLLSQHEGWLLIGAVLCYLGAMFPLWGQLFQSSSARRDEGSLPLGDDGGSSRLTAAQWGRLLLWSGAVLHLLALVGQGAGLFAVRAGVAALFGWILMLAYLLIGHRIGRASLGVFVTPLALLAALYSLTVPRLHPFLPSASIDSQWLVMHVVMILIGYVALAFAFAASLLYLLQEALLKRKRLSGLWQRLPSLQVADEWIYHATTFGLVMLTLGLFTGMVWRQWHEPDYAVLHDPKVLFSIATWLTFALYLAARWWLGWRGHRTNLVVVYGFVLLVISFLGTPHLLTGIRIR